MIRQQTVNVAVMPNLAVSKEATLIPDRQILTDSILELSKSAPSWSANLFIHYRDSTYAQEPRLRDYKITPPQTTTLQLHKHLSHGWRSFSLGVAPGTKARGTDITLG
ncbi:hypothetical protein EVAR_70889_1 [Eumeta japonica]|uniref:Uncharacterized protein n=1 Tax=Eumeta variegata TaxID=151549 RepID=A0A4C1T985_EUMVA|nr:hypothetical protein EVAR_70889_1 [Eumeta japonica]